VRSSLFYRRWLQNYKFETTANDLISISLLENRDSFKWQDFRNYFPIPKNRQGQKHLLQTGGDFLTGLCPFRPAGSYRRGPGCRDPGRIEEQDISIVA
jgi:hypothetical protein